MKSYKTARSADVNKTQWIANLMLVAAWGVLLPQAAMAQTSVAIVDLGVVFEKHAEFQNQLKLLRQEAEGLQKDVMQKRQELQVKMEETSGLYNPNSPEFKQREKDLALQAAQLDLDAREKVRELTIREANIHYNTYNEVTKYIEEYCTKKEIRLVMRYTGGEMKPSDPDSIMQQINGAVVFYRPEKDITNAIVQSMAATKSGVSGQ
jgi:Skp family chaperone for outer membrane proteins